MICQHCGMEVLTTNPPRITPNNIIELVCEEYDISPDKLKAKRRYREIVLPRQIAYYLMRKLVRERNGWISHKKAGMIFGQDHTTVIHSIQTIDDLLFSDPDIKHRVEYLEGLLTSSVN